jgi:hypothetical protein
MSSQIHSLRIRGLVFLIVLVAVLYPLVVWYKSVNLSASSGILFSIFPAFGLIAFSVMWLHIVGASFKSTLEKYFNFEKFVSVSSKVVLVSLILHPLILFIALISAGYGGGVFGYIGPNGLYLIWLAVIAWLIFIGYDMAKKFKEQDFFARHWQTIKFISTLAFFLVLIHSLGLGTNLQTGSLRYVWIFYGATAAGATLYNYLLRPKA